MRRCILCLLSVVGLAPALAAADSLTDAPGAETRLTFVAGLAEGGDELATVFFSGGGSEDIKAGSGIYLNGGFMHSFADSPFDLQMTLGYFIENTSATNTQARFSRYPLDAMAFYRNGEHRIGAGLTYHMSPKLDLDQLGGTVTFENTNGFVLEYGYNWFGVRYTAIDYDTEEFSYTADGNNISVLFNLGFSGW